MMFIYMVLFQDAMQESFKTTGDFFKTSGVKRVEPFVAERRVYSLLNMIMWSIVVLCPMFYYSFKICISGQIYWAVCLAAVLGTCEYISLSSGNTGYTKIIAGISRGGKVK